MPPTPIHTGHARATPSSAAARARGARYALPSAAPLGQPQTPMYTHAPRWQQPERAAGISAGSQRLLGRFDRGRVQKLAVRSRAEEATSPFVAAGLLSYEEASASHLHPLQVRPNRRFAGVQPGGDALTLADIASGGLDSLDRDAERIARMERKVDAIWETLQRQRPRAEAAAAAKETDRQTRRAWEDAVRAMGVLNE